MQRSTERQDKRRSHKLKIFASLLSQRQTASCNYGSLCHSVPTMLSGSLAQALLALFSVPSVENWGGLALQVESFSCDGCLSVGLLLNLPATH